MKAKQEEEEEEIYRWDGCGRREEGGSLGGSINGLSLEGEVTVGLVFILDVLRVSSGGSSPVESL